ncbi:general odorant-binding protein 56h [Drosophila tropicalis]|uniref:general odorant-binding protein 56h n=1 Tax=Drosophila tropicalis TaxID=46794 RepID=UPI0035ABCBC7
MKATLALTLLLSYLTAFLVTGDAPDIGKVTTACMNENGVSAQDFADLKSGATKPEDVKDNVKCATQCILVKLGFMDAQGNALTDNIKSKFASSPMASAVNTAMTTCGGVKGANPCDTAFQILACLQQNSQAISSMMH